MVSDQLPCLSEFLGLVQIPTALPRDRKARGPPTCFQSPFGGQDYAFPLGDQASGHPTISAPSLWRYPSSHADEPFNSPSATVGPWALSMRLNCQDKSQSTVDDITLPNMLSINVLLEFEDTPFANRPVSWDDLEISLQVLEQKSVTMDTDTPNSQQLSHFSSTVPHTIHDQHHTMLIPGDDSSKDILQQSIDIMLENLTREPSIDLFQVNLIFRERHETEDWCINASCYIGLQSARKVLYPIRCSFSKILVDSSGRNPTFYCSFCVKRSPKREETDAPGTANNLFHKIPSEQDIKQDLEEQGSDMYNLNAFVPVEPSSLVQSSSHGMRPIGPYGRLMTRLQRATFLSIRKKFASQSSREWKRSLLDSDLYPLFTLGRDECAKEMGTCSTWLKVRMRERGIKVWPNRKLIHSTGTLYRLKKQLSDITKHLETESSAQVEESKFEIQRQIQKVRAARLKIVQDSCSPAFFEKFKANAPETVLDPDWEN